MAHPNRVLIVDVQHIAYTHARAQRQLFWVVDNQRINTTIQTGIIKNVWKWSNRGEYPTVVCFDRPCPLRKAYIEQSLGTEYKAGRASKSYAFLQALNSAGQTLHNGSVPALAVPGYEADDLVGAAVSSAKVQYPDSYIDVVTGDTDLVPLVDDQVSVFLRSVKGTSSVHKEAEKTRYVQVTPDTYEGIISARSAFKGLSTPYNTLLLLKLLRGDKSDGLASPVKHLFRPKQFNALVSEVARDLSPLQYTYASKAELFGYLFDSSSPRVPLEYRDSLDALWNAYCLNFPYPGAEGLPTREVVPDFTIQAFDPSKLVASAKVLGIRLS